VNVLYSLVRVFQLNAQRNQNAQQALAPGSMHARVHVSTIVMALAAITALTGFLFYWPLLAVGSIVFVASLLFVIVQAIIDTARSG
jgi:hypothetical protein